MWGRHLELLAAVFAGWVNRQQREVISYLQAENQVLRSRLGSKRPRFTDAERRQLAIAAKAIGRNGLFALNTIVTPDTLLRWHRKLSAQKYDGSLRRGPGRPRKSAEIQQLVVKMAKDNPQWGYTRIRGALFNLGHDVGRTSIKRILDDKGIEPAPERGKRTPWSTFLKAHWGAISAADFFTVEVLRPHGLVRYFVLFIIDLKSRSVETASVCKQPSGAWMCQMARKLTAFDTGFLVDTRYLIHDRDRLCTEAFKAILESAGVR